MSLSTCEKWVGHSPWPACSLLLEMRQLLSAFTVNSELNFALYVVARRENLYRGTVGGRLGRSGRRRRQRLARSSLKFLGLFSFGK